MNELWPPTTSQIQTPPPPTQTLETDGLIDWTRKTRGKKSKLERRRLELAFKGTQGQRITRMRPSRAASAPRPGCSAWQRQWGSSRPSFEEY